MIESIIISDFARVFVYPSSNPIAPSQCESDVSIRLLSMEIHFQLGASGDP